MEVLMPRIIRSLIVASSLFVAASAGAQPSSGNNIEIGGGGGVLSSWEHSQPGGDLRVTFPVNHRIAIDALVAMAPAQHNETFGLYGVLVKHRIGSRPASDLQPFLSYGVIGIFVRYHEEEYRYRSATGSTIVSPAYDHGYVSPPLFGMFGGGVERRVLPRLSVRVEAQAVMFLVLPVGVRIAAGASVPIGRLAHAPAEAVAR
jgi:hypothetical protein